VHADDVPWTTLNAISLDHLVGRVQQLRWYGQAERMAVLQLITNSNLVGSRTGKSAGFSPLRNSPDVKSSLPDDVSASNRLAGRGRRDGA
jgi:hypothetical protein